MHFPPMPERASLRPSYWEDVKATARVNNNLLQIFFGEIVISIAQSAKFSFKQNLEMNRNNVNKVESLSSSLWKCARNSIVSFSQRIGMFMLHGRLIAHQSDYKNGHDCSCPMSFPQSAYLFLYFARRSAKAG